MFRSGSYEKRAGAIVVEGTGGTEHAVLLTGLELLHPTECVPKTTIFL